MVDSSASMTSVANWIQQAGSGPAWQQLAAPGVVWVPCIPNPIDGTFTPLYTMATLPASAMVAPPPVKPRVATPINRGGLKHKAWTESEDTLLKELIEEKGVKQWLLVANKLNSTFHNGEPARKGKHCRERWYNHLDPSLNSTTYTEGEWTYEEDIQLLKLQASIGKRWSQLALHMPGRTENAVKNRYNSLIRKAKLAYNMQMYPDESVAYYLIQEFEARAAEV